MNLNSEETYQLIQLLAKAEPRTEVAGRYEVIITPTILAPEDFVPRKKVCLGSAVNVIGETTCKIAEDMK